MQDPRQAQGTEAQGPSEGRVKQETKDKKEQLCHLIRI